MVTHGRSDRAVTVTDLEELRSHHGVYRTLRAPWQGTFHGYCQRSQGCASGGRLGTGSAGLSGTYDSGRQERAGSALGLLY